MEYIGKLDKNKIGEYANKIITDDVILTNERIMHIKEHHPEIIDKEIKYVKEVLQNPEYIFKDRKNENTILLVKTIKKDNKTYKMVVKLNTNKYRNNIENSIISFWHIGKKKLNQ